MSFPTKALTVLLQFARGKVEFGPDVVDAGIEVLKYVYYLVVEKLDVKSASEPLAIEDALEAAISEGEGAVGITPSVWITIGLWVLEKVLTRILKD